MLVAEHVRKIYRTGEIEVAGLVDLSLSVNRGEMVAVMGPSGSGKTTLRNCLSGLDDIDGGRVLLGGTHAIPARKRAIEMLERVGLGHRTGHRPNEMSGGEQQRVTVARALASRPAIVWADEPTGNLDSQMADQVVELLHELNRADGQTIVLVTHDAGIGASVQRLVRMRDGRLTADERGVGDGRPEHGAQQPVGAPAEG